jgi:hypothetical protein
MRHEFPVHAELDWLQALRKCGHRVVPLAPSQISAVVLAFLFVARDDDPA